MRPVKVVWNQFVKAPHHRSADEPVPASVVEAWRESASFKHPAFELEPDLVVELPAPEWGHADLLVYLPRRGWLVRREHTGGWYVDIGALREVQDGLYLWTDLWLDIIAPEPATRYHLLDADEFAEVLREGRISPELAAQVMEHLHALVNCLRDGRFPPEEVRRAEAFAAEQRSSSSA